MAAAPQSRRDPTHSMFFPRGVEIVKGINGESGGRKDSERAGGSASGWEGAMDEQSRLDVPKAGVQQGHCTEASREQDPACVKEEEVEVREVCE
ncbi:unnamed protein product [Pleuronectes platessa]|uniref:Uncharacterized protein n=1 Tax=Pleuronectes platessa TaxID=8262 RepID=A0A9N7UFV1_PLEPL|nr:unnamed protein product [Pleuronectes platessa]